MIHTISADNKFFERPTIADGTNDTPAPDRPPRGTVVNARLSSTASALPDLMLDEGGLWTYSWEDDATVSAVQFSADSGATWSDPIYSIQSLDNMASAVVDLGTLTETVYDNGNDILTLQTAGDAGGAQILVQETGGYPGKTGSGSALWVGKDKPPISSGYASGNDLYFQTSSI